MTQPAKIYRCTLADCKRSTVVPHHNDPRKRWVTDLNLRDDENCAACAEDKSEHGPSKLTHTCTVRIVHMCPQCSATMLNLTEEHYRRLERAERIAAGVQPASELVQ
jgi:hypothetical protein